MLLFYSQGTCAFAEMVVLEWLGRPYELCRVERDERKGPRYRRLVNAHGQVPAMKIGDRILTENSALLAYLGDLAPDLQLMPTPGGAERYEMYRLLAWLDSGYHVAHYPMFAPGRYVAEEELYPQVREHALAGIREVVAELDGILAGNAHVAFGRRTILDAYVFAMARWMEKRFDYPTDFPHVTTFLERMREDAGLQFALAIENGEVTEAVPGHDAFRGQIVWANYEKQIGNHTEFGE